MTTQEEAIKLFRNDLKRFAKELGIDVKCREKKIKHLHFRLIEVDAPKEFRKNLSPKIQELKAKYLDIFQKPIVYHLENSKTRNVFSVQFA